MCRSKAVFAALAALVPASFAAAGVVDLSIVAQDVTVDRSAGVAAFSVTFNRPPIFVALPPEAPDAFQYEIDVDSADTSTNIDINQIDAVIRGAEIWEGEGIPVRDATGAAQGPEAGGWGPVRALLPFNIEDNTITFTAPLDELGDSDGKFRYRAFAIDPTGATGGEVIGAVVPTPAALGPGMMLLGGVLIVRSFRRRLI
jgi:hypothetical protein